MEKSKTIQYSELPERLWATTGIKLTNVDTYHSFGRLRNSIQHFASPQNTDCGVASISFIFDVIDPFINQCWNLYAIDYNEDHEPYKYLIEALLSSEIYFLISPKAVENLPYVDFEWDKNSLEYRQKMQERITDAGGAYWPHSRISEWRISRRQEIK